MALFAEEKKVLHMLLQEWYAGIEAATMEADSIFSEKGKMYDRKNPAWDRMEWPNGFQHEISKKSNRVVQILDGFDPDSPYETDWDEVNEELGDILNYCRMLISLNEMMRVRGFTHSLDEMVDGGVFALKDRIEADQAAMDQAAEESMTPRDWDRVELIIGTQPGAGPSGFKIPKEGA